MASTHEFCHIVRLGGTDIRGDLTLPFALTKVKGVGQRFSRIIIHKAGLPSDIRIGFLSEEEITKIEDILANPYSFDIPAWLLNRHRDPVTGEDLHVIGNDLATANKNDIDRMKKTHSVKGVRHQLGLRVRGQRTRTTGRGGKSVGVQRKKLTGTQAPPAE